ncbi:MAG: thiamine phosphate synthase [Deltaproteobacteria bacterium]|nr:thiamine phosphate synthase [Deltaproteobacteria bacterium]
MKWQLVAITDGGDAARVEDVVVRALAGDERGVCAVQLRDKAASGRALFEQATRLREVTRRTGSGLLVNDRVDVALAVGADGVQLGERGLGVAVARELVRAAGADGFVVGASVHDVEGARRAAREGADFVVFAPVFEVPGKGPAAGVPGLAEVVRAVGDAVPVVALGGIAGAEEADACRAAGARAVAVMRAVMEANDPARAVRQLLGEVVWGCP